MGVKAADVGPVAWKTLEGIAVLVDQLLAKHAKNPKGIELIYNLAIAIFMSLAFLFPCVYCRVSFRKANFTDGKKSLKTKIHVLLKTPDGAKKWVWSMHDFVNRKLRKQQVDKATSLEEVELVRQTWANKMLSYEEALSTRFSKHTIDTDIWWLSFYELVGYMVCDWRKDTGSYLFSLLNNVSMLLRIAQVRGADYMIRTSEEMRETYGPYPDLPIDIRFEMIYIYFMKTFKVLGRPMPYSQEEYQALCSSSVVGCIK